jgi:hypothetical protein
VPESTAGGDRVRRDWDLLFVLPNLSLSAGQRFRSERFLICSLNDWRIRKCLRQSEANASGKRLARRYRTVWGDRYQPSVLAFRHQGSPPDAEDLRNYRNACAISTVVHGAAKILTGGQGLTSWSDAFCFSRFMPGHVGILSLDGSSSGYWDTDDLADFRGTSAEVIDAPQHFSVQWDTVLLRRLARLIVTPDLMAEDARQRVFRSLAMAFHASRYPSDGLTATYDLGTRVALWVSAFETLLNPLDRDVTMSQVVAFFNQASWTDSTLARMNHAEFKRSGEVRGRTCFAGALYQRLYSSRNRFLHGSPVHNALLKYRGRPLVRLAPVLFGLALHEYLRHVPIPAKATGWIDDLYFGQGVLEEGLEAARHRPKRR